MCTRFFLLFLVLFAPAEIGLANQPSNCSSLYAAIGTAKAPAGMREIWKTKYARFDSIGPEDNIHFIRLARAAHSESSKLLFFDMENAVLKELNDKVILDKDLVTALTNYHKKIFFDIVQADTVLRTSLAGRYSDFKALRFAFTPNNPELVQHLQSAFLNAGAIFEKEISSLALESNLALGRGISKHPRNWHLAGIGTTPDEAGLASRHARRLKDPEISARTLEFSHIAAELEKELENTEYLRSMVTLHFKDIAGALTDIGNEKKILSREVIELVRKVSPLESTRAAYLKALQKDFKSRFRTSISDDQAILLRDYVSQTDRFSPGIYIPKREVIDLSKAEHGVVSADFKGQNARNISGTMSAIALNADKSITAIVHAIRAEEVAVTKELDAKKVTFSKAVIEALQQKENIFFSGDDGILIPKNELSEAQKKRFLQLLLGRAPPDSFRITFLDKSFVDSRQPIPVGVRSQLIVQAETIEKNIRKDLIALVSRERLDNLLFAIDYSPAQQGKGQVKILIGGEHITMNEERSLRKLVESYGLDLKEIINVNEKSP